MVVFEVFPDVNFSRIMGDIDSESIQSSMN